MSSERLVSLTEVDLTNLQTRPGGAFISYHPKPPSRCSSSIRDLVWQLHQNHGDDYAKIASELDSLRKLQDGDAADITALNINIPDCHTSHTNRSFVKQFIDDQKKKRVGADALASSCSMSDSVPDSMVDVGAAAGVVPDARKIVEMNSGGGATLEVIDVEEGGGGGNLVPPPNQCMVLAQQ
eukprot:Cvel_9134.t2-p1 / transcript=Cvel_9134.t2 / gene=Cvel_9134 / organism=Chromera_velia_CCMP2878 / gene_product=hypothetical protein / transcript_product=hypothetical protein / location=Cvel_scaffold519:45461-46204(-) / protein_length=181 / sequence_SO=supercontig / SO=protein_coding / is_pseudo=false